MPGKIHAERHWSISPVTETGLAAVTQAELARLVALLVPAGGTTRVEVRMAGETVWLDQAQMADLFQSAKQNVDQHIRNVFAEGELAPESVVKDFFTTAVDGKQYRTKHYNLDVIISVGYRVKSHRGTAALCFQFGCGKDLLPLSCCERTRNVSFVATCLPALCPRQPDDVCKRYGSFLIANLTVQFRG